MPDYLLGVLLVGVTCYAIHRVIPLVQRANTYLHQLHGERATSEKETPSQDMPKDEMTPLRYYEEIPS